MLFCVYYNFDTCIYIYMFIHTHTHPGCVLCCSRSKLGQQSFCKCGDTKNHRTKSAGWPNYLGTGCLLPTHDWGGCVNMYASACQRRITPRWIETTLHKLFVLISCIIFAQSCVEVLKLPLLDRRVRRERPGCCFRRSEVFVKEKSQDRDKQKRKMKHTKDHKSRGMFWRGKREMALTRFMCKPSSRPWRWRNRRWEKLQISSYKQFG